MGISHMLELPVGLCMHAFPITSNSREIYVPARTTKTLPVYINMVVLHISSAFLCEEGRKKKKHHVRTGTNIKKHRVPFC